METKFQSYVRPRPPKAGAGVSILDRFPKVVYGFVEGAAKIREASQGDPAKALFHPYWERIIASGLAWGRELLSAPIALSIKNDVTDMSIQVLYGHISKSDRSRVLKRVRSVSVGPSIADEGPQIWYNGHDLILSCSVYRQARPQYFYFSKVENLTPTDIRLVGAFGRVFEEVLATTVDIEFLSDQRRLLNRRTIVAQLRPNDLFYQALRRLHKFVGWQRGAVIVVPSLNQTPATTKSRDEGISWQIAAERLRGVHETSRRIGKKYRMSTSSPSDFTDLVVSKLDPNKQSLSAWEKLCWDLILDSEDLPPRLASARSAVVVYMQPEEHREKAVTEIPTSPQSGSFAVILTDPRENYFSEKHIDVTRRLFLDICEIVYRSGVVSQRLVSLWMPTTIESGPELAPMLAPEPELKMEVADEIEALGSEVLASETGSVLSVDALQVLQFRRGAADKFAVQDLDCIRVLAIKEDDFSMSESIPVKLLDGMNLKLKLHLDSQPLVATLFNNTEFALKDSRGIGAKRLPGLFSSRGGHRPFKSILAIPICSEGETSGAVIAYRQTPSEFADIDKLLLRALAARVGERIELRRQLADRARHNSCLYRVAHAKTPAHARLELVKGARELLNADYAFMMAAEDDQERNRTKTESSIVDVSHTWTDSAIRVPPIKVGKKGITGTVYSSGASLAVSDVSNSEIYIPLRRNKRIVEMGSELAVPIVMPPSLTDQPEDVTANRVLGVLDTLWSRRHDITAREVRTLAALALHAASVLQLTNSLQSAQHTRDQLRALLEKVKTLQGLGTDSEVFNWLWSVASKITSADVMCIWSHTLDSDQLELIYYRGLRTTKLRKGETIKYGGSWTGDIIQDFRNYGRKSAFEGYQSPTGGIQIPNTPIENHESRLIYCISPTSSILGGSASKQETVWAISLYRLRRSDFDERDRSLLQLASEYCESTLQSLSAARAQERTLKLAAATRDIALYLVDNLRTAPDEVVKHTLRRTCEELSAYCVSVLYYHEAGDSYVAPTHFAYPERFSRNPAPRPGGISEVVRNKPGVTEVADIGTPPKDLKKALRTSPFLKANPSIRSMIAGGLYEASKSEEFPHGKFCGIFHINFAQPKRLSKEEHLFVNTIQRFLTECGGLEAALTRMREQASNRIQAVRAPNLVFDEILKVALDGIRAELPSEIAQNPKFRLGGNLYMVESGDLWELLSIRANVGERTGDHSGRQYVGEGVIGRVAASGQAISLDDTDSPQASQLEYLPYLKDMASELAVPIRLDQAKSGGDVAEGVIGVLNIECSQRNVFKSRQQELLFRYVSEPPVSLILDLAERYGSLLWEAKSSTDRFVSEAATIILHDLTKPIRQVIDKVRTIRHRLGVGGHTTYLDLIKIPLRDLEEESLRWFKLKDTGFLHLQPEILEARGPLDVVEQVVNWAERHDPPIQIRLHSVKEFFIEQGHKELIARVLENLYSNSQDAGARAHLSSPQIWIELGLSEPIGDSQHLNLDFSDNGPGIEHLDEARGRLFRHFAVKPSAGQWKMGLPCARQMMEAMGGYIEIIDSKPGKRTTFRLRFSRSVLGLRRSSRAGKGSPE